MMHRVFEPQAGQPAPVHQRPGRPVVVMAMTQQEAGQLLPSLTQGPHRRQTRPHQIADRLVRRIRNPDRRQLAGAVKLGQVDRVPAVGLDPLTRLARDQRRSNHYAAVPCCGQLSFDAVAAGAGFVTEAQLRPSPRQLAGQCIQGGRRVRDLAVLAHLAPLARLGKRHRNRVLVHIQTDVGDRLVHDPSPMHEARRRPSGATLEILHTVRRVAPISGEHLV
jgi:hypothetical protein